MSRPALMMPTTDPTPLFETFRGHHATGLLTASVSHLGVFARLADGPLAVDSLREALGLSERAYTVLATGLKALGLLFEREDGRIGMTVLAREHLVPGGPLDVSGYFGLAAQHPGVLELVDRLRTDRPAGADDKKTGAAFIFREGIESAMDHEASARNLTLALAGRARNVAPVLAEKYPLDGVTKLLDVGGGTGIYSIAWLLRHDELTAAVWDRPEVLKVAREIAEKYGVLDRLELIPGDMFADPVPTGFDAALLSNVLHDWDVPECRRLVARHAGALPSGGRLLIHDVFLNDALDGPLPVALYSTDLFCLTEGRAYSAREYQSWLVEAGLQPGPVVPTLIHCGVMAAAKS